MAALRHHGGRHSISMANVGFKRAKDAKSYVGHIGAERAPFIKHAMYSERIVLLGAATRSM